MFALMSSTSFCMAGFSWPLPMISKACTMGMPADIMVASWRLNTAMSPGSTLPPARTALALRLDARGRDALAPQIGAQRRLVRRERLAADLVAALVLALPDEIGFLSWPLLPIPP